jgi:hypothetical protein
MTPAKELPIVIEKSQEDVEQIITLVHSSNLPEGTKPFVIGCIHLASWINYVSAIFKLLLIVHNGEKQPKLKSLILAFAITIIFLIKAVRATIFFLPVEIN